MATLDKAQLSSPGDAPAHQPYVPDDVEMPEFTWSAVLLGAVLGIVFGASSLYLVLKVGLTVSASIPVAVLSITLFRVFSKIFGIRRATILENNVVQTTGSAGESIAFGVGVTIPALMLLGFDMEVTRVMTVGVLGGLLGILMMIPLRRAFIVRQHGHLKFPEGTACADVLIVGEKGGATAATVFTGFGVAFLHKFTMKVLHLWQEDVTQPLYTASGQGLKGAVIGGELSPELLGVGYIIGPRTSATILAGGLLSYLVLIPAIVLFSANQSAPIPPATGLVSAMSANKIRNEYVLYIGAGAVAAGGIISMIQAMPLIAASVKSGLRDLAASRNGTGDEAKPQALAGAMRRTERDLSLRVVFLGSLALIAAMAVVPALGLGITFHGLVGATLIVVFGFLFVTVSSRLTGEIGSSSNPISGMTVATLLFTCLIFLLLGRTDKMATLTALTVAAVVCIASSNGGTTAQDLKTGYLVGANPRHQQLAILVGALTSALVIGFTLVLLNDAGTVYTKKAEHLPDYRVSDVSSLTGREYAGGEYAGIDATLYHVLNVAAGEIAAVPQGKYLVDDEGRIRYLVDPAINGKIAQRDDGKPMTNKFDAPKTRLMAIIIDGILNQKLPWGLVMIGAVIAITLELAGVPALPFAVGVYLPIHVSAPIFAGGALRWAIEKIKPAREGETEMSPGVLLSSGYIAGGAIAATLAAFLYFTPDQFRESFDLTAHLGKTWNESNWPALAAFGVLMLILALVSLGMMLGGRQTKSDAGREEKGAGDRI